MIALLLPLMAMALMEVGLRLAGFGFPTGFFLKSHQEAGSVWIENQRFGERFFPAGIARTPEPLLLKEAKATNECRIFVFGESAAMGDPEPDYGFPRMLEVLLQAEYPKLQIVVVNVAMTAINSHVIREIARDCLPCEGDVWVVYMGNNEVVGPYGAGTVFSAKAPSLPLVRGSIALRSLRMGQWLDSLRWRGDRFAEWEGMEMFLKQQVAQSDPRMTRVYGHFRENLGDILGLAGRARIPVLLCTVTSNLKDCPPFASLHAPGLSGSSLAEWQQHFESGNRLFEEKKWGEALQEYERAARLDDQHAELEFRRGRCLLALGRDKEARAMLAGARDLDTLRFRADNRINDLIRQTAAGHPEVKLLDTVAVFDQHSANGIAGEEFFYEHVHFNLEGNHLLARGAAEALQPLIQARFPALAAPPATGMLSQEECVQRLGLTDWNRLQLVEEVRKRLQQAPFTGQEGQRQRDERWKQAAARLHAAGTSEGLSKAVATVRKSVAARPDDWILHRNLARLLEATGDALGAANEWREVARLLPHGVDAFFHLGNLAESLQQGIDVSAYFREALRRKPDSVEVMNGLGLVLVADGKTSAAIEQFERALRLKPKFIEARVNYGQLLTRLGRLEDARAHYETALRYNSNCVAAHVNLGRLLTAQGQRDAAVRQYQEALRIEPEHAVAHYNLGNALSDLGRSAEALEHYAAAARANPSFAEAHNALGLALAQAGRADEALAAFSEAARLKPDYVDARLNLGVALARRGRYDDAIGHFHEVLRIKPDHVVARQYLDQATSRKAGR